MTDRDDLALAESLCARLCHDLAGAVGAVGTGAELLAEETDEGGLGGEALALLVDSAAAAVGRLRFLRLALGSGGSAMRTSELKDLVRGFFTSPGGGSEQIRLDWPTGDEGMWPAERAKLLLNLVLLARGCLPRGGLVTVRPGVPEAGLPSVAASGSRAAPGETAVALAAKGARGLGPREVQAYYAGRLAENLGLTINYKHSHDWVEFVTEKN